MFAKKCALTVLGPTLALLTVAPPALATSITRTCEFHDEWPFRKYDCRGTNVLYGGWVCSSHWTTPHPDNDPSHPDSRVISQTCVGPGGYYTCNEVGWRWYQCSGTGIYDGRVCTSYTWQDDDPDPTPDGIPGNSSCFAIVDVGSS